MALGTSLPDMLASRTVTRLEKYADGAMIHITGSIAVNVLMGVGMPWLVAAGYHSMRVCVDSCIMFQQFMKSVHVVLVSYKLIHDVYFLI